MGFAKTRPELAGALLPSMSRSPREPALDERVRVIFQKSASISAVYFLYTLKTGRSTGRSQAQLTVYPKILRAVHRTVKYRYLSPSTVSKGDTETFQQGMKIFCDRCGKNWKSATQTRRGQVTIRTSTYLELACNAALHNLEQQSASLSQFVVLDLDSASWRPTF